MIQPFSGDQSSAVTVFDLEPDADPPKVLAIGPDPAGNLLEIIWLELEDVKTRRRGRPPMESGPADVVPVRIDPELRAAIEAPCRG